MISAMLSRLHGRPAVLVFLGGLLVVAGAREPLAACGVPGDPAAGKAIYEETCVACHGKDGGGAVPGVPKLSNEGGPLSKPDDVLIANITNGFSSGRSPLSMPPRGSNPDLTDEGVVDVLGYMRKTFGCE